MEYAQIVNGKVENVIEADDDFINNLPDAQNYKKNDPNIRKNIVQIGMLYDAEADAFYAPKPHGEYVLNKETYKWEPIG